MKKKFDKSAEVYCEDSLDALNRVVSENGSLPVGFAADRFPFTKDLLDILREENRFIQHYYYIKRGTSFAFFVLYENRMNIFTFGKMKLFYPVNTVGFPCSLSCPGYVTNDEDLLFEFIKTIKGAKLVLNVETPAVRKDYVMGQTLPTCKLDLSDISGNGLRYGSIDEYLHNMRSAYRRRIKLAIAACSDVVIGENVKDERIYELYLNTYNKSGYKLECLEKGFFLKADADNLVFYRSGKPIGFVQLKLIGDYLDFMFCGMDYKYNTADLYYYMIYNIICFAITHKCRTVDLGQTSEETKMKFGAIPQKKFFYAHHTNPLINFAIKHGRRLLEYHYDFPAYHVMKEKT